MTEKIYSQQDPTKLLATIFNINELDATRFNSSNEQEILQVSALKLAQGRVVQPHWHLPIERSTVGTQESWIVWQGRINVRLYDLDQTLVREFDLAVGDCMVLYHGGHSLTVLEENTKLIEIKNGPYYGPERDAQRID